MSKRSLFSTGLLVALTLALSLVWSGCENSADITAPTVEDTQVFTPDTQQFESVMRLQERETQRFMDLPDVVGTATGLNDRGEPVIQILTEKAMPAGRLPRSIDGVEVVEVVTGKLVAMKGKPGGGGGGGVSHTAIQTPPIQLGTSGGWRYDLANGYCCGGTLGSLIKLNADGKQYIMSNYHVLEADIVNGGNSRVARTGDAVIQPALIDVSCNAGSSQNVAKLLVMNALPDNNVDVAIAEVVPDMVRSDGAILEIGTLSRATVDAFVNQRVKKSGRTTGLARAKVSGLNATVNITYENECAGGTAFTRTFTGQIVIANRGSKFLAGGDSGSLMVEDVDVDPSAVGLLYAGSSTSAIANPIDDVLGFLNATMVGN